MQDHDGGYKLLFSHPRMVEELLRGFVHERWVEELDFATLEPCHTSLVADDQRQRHTDVVWRLRWRGNTVDWFYVYILLEFQSKPDPFMAVRMLGYVALLLGDLQRKGRLRRARELPRLPVVLPLVLYNGCRPWNAPLDLASLFPVVPPGFERYLPQLTYLLLDESRLTPEALALPGNWVAALFQLEKAQPAELPHLTAKLATQLPQGEDPELQRTFTGWLLRRLQKSLRGATIPTEVETLEEVAMLEETLKEWWNSAREAGRQEGKENGLREGEVKGLREGEVKGRRDTILRLVKQRFGKLPVQFRRQVAALQSVAELERLFDRALAARSLEELRLG